MAFSPQLGPICWFRGLSSLLTSPTLPSSFFPSSSCSLLSSHPSFFLPLSPLAHPPLRPVHVPSPPF
eukprot:5180170-Pyramimonas_sp.AAC.1